MEQDSPPGALGSNAGLGARSRSVTMAELIRPSDGSMVEFWCHRMSRQGKEGTGIRGWFRDGLFWSRDNADHYALGEVTHWISIRTRMQCAARGCDGCLVCAPNGPVKRLAEGKSGSPTGG